MQSAVNSRRQGDENLDFSVADETMKLLCNKLYGYQIIDRSLHSVTKYMDDEQTHAAVNNKMFKRVGHFND